MVRVNQTWDYHLNCAKSNQESRRQSSGGTTISDSQELVIVCCESVRRFPINLCGFISISSKQLGVYLIHSTTWISVLSWCFLGLLSDCYLCSFLALQGGVLIATAAHTAAAALELAGIYTDLHVPLIH